MPKKGTKTKKKKTTKKLVVKHVESDEEILSEDVVSEEEVSSSEIDLLEEDSNGDANEVLDVSKTPDFESELSLLKPFVRQLNENKITVKELVREDRSNKTSNPEQTRYVPKSVVSPVVTNIYGDKIALIIWTDEPEGIIIENKAAAQAYKSYFDLMWDNAKR